MNPLLSVSGVAKAFAGVQALPKGHYLAYDLESQTATFFKPAHPVRSSCRVEPLAGASGGSAGAGPA